MTENETPEQLEKQHWARHFNEAGGFTPLKGCQLCEDAVDSVYDMGSDLG